MMTILIECLLVFLGGGIGASARYLLSEVIRDKAGNEFPWTTLTINITGSLVIGLFMGFSIAFNWSTGWRLFFVIGLLGGYTTFSTFSYEILHHISNKNHSAALTNMFGQVIAGIFAAWVGTLLAQMMLGGKG